MFGSVIAEYPEINGMRSNAASASETDLLLVEYTAPRSEVNLTMHSRNTILLRLCRSRGSGAAVFLAQHSSGTFTVIRSPAWASWR